MVNFAIAESYLKRAKIKFELFYYFMKQKEYTDVIKESQKIVKLCQKRIPIKSGVKTPKCPDSTCLIFENRGKLPEDLINKIVSLCRQYIWLRS